MFEQKKSGVGRLFISQVADDFDADNDLALGPWCFVDKEDVFPDWENLPFIDPFVNPDEKTKMSRACRELIAWQVAKTGVALGDTYGVDRPYRFWWTLLARHLTYVIPAAWRRWCQIERFAEAHRTLPLSVAIAETKSLPTFDFADTIDLQNRGLLSAAFDFWLSSMLLVDQMPSAWTTIEFPVPDLPNAYVSPLDDPGLIRALRSKASKMLGRRPVSHIPGASSKDMILLNLRVLALPKRGDTDEFREPLHAQIPDCFPAAFIDRLQDIVRCCLPKTFTNEFVQNDHAAAQERYRPQCLHVNGGATVNDRSNFSIAHAVMKGERVVRLQHGSDYGMMTNLVMEACGEYHDTAFLTWGWQNQHDEQANFLRAPAPMLADIKDRHQFDSDLMMLVGSKMWVRSYRLDQTPEPTYATLYRSRKIAFLDALSSDVRKAMHYRPYMRGLSDLEDETYVATHAPDVAVYRGDMVDALTRARLVVLDHPGTTLCLGMAANTPTICYWQPDAWPIDPEAQPYFDALRDVGILFDTPEQAAAQVNMVADDVAAWWRGDSCQQARRQWTNQFAFTRDTWRQDWINILKSI